MSNVAFDDPAYTIIFIIVNQNASMFSFINKPEGRMDFFWSRWGEWREILQPYSVHAFLVKSYNTKGGTGQGFSPEIHLCEFLNMKEARVFNAAYLMRYNKIYEDGTAAEATDMSCQFAEVLLDVQDEREDWIDIAQHAAHRAFSSELFSTFFGDNPIPLSPKEYDLADIVDTGPVCEMMREWVELNGEECPIYETRPQYSSSKAH